jgi:hypothetical protein
MRGVGPHCSWSCWTNALGLAVPIRRCLHYAMMTHLPHVNMMAETMEVVESMLLLF